MIVYAKYSREIGVDEYYFFIIRISHLRKDIRRVWIIVLIRVVYAS